MPVPAFIRDNARWLAAGFLLFLFSAFGQTYVIALTAGDIRREFGLSHGAFGTLYMAATLASALTLTRLGQMVDHRPARPVALFVTAMLALAAALMALSTHIALLALALFLLRLFGQGMMSHTAFTLMGRWFSAQRGRAISLATLGFNAGEAALPPLAVALIAAIGWRGAWGLAAASLLLLALPALALLLGEERRPAAAEPERRAAAGRDWTRGEMLRDPCFYLAKLAMIPPAFIGNTVFFHQVYLVELRGWSLEAFASAFVLFAGLTIVFVLLSGPWVDRRSARALLPVYLLPLGLACLLLGTVEAPWAAFAFMALYGVTNGMSLTLFGALWPETYGVRHLGAIRAVIVAILVFASALGPGLTGLLIDAGVSYPALIAALGAYCLAISLAMRPVVRRLALRSATVAAHAS
ncbi:MAG TPA: MFS transporter [Alphaproteobacteria bacterium]|nr:MFS transporter [Alphaproteobacteria bacterium]